MEWQEVEDGKPAYGDVVLALWWTFPNGATRKAMRMPPTDGTGFDRWLDPDNLDGSCLPSYGRAPKYWLPIPPPPVAE